MQGMCDLEHHDPLWGYRHTQIPETWSIAEVGVGSSSRRPGLHAADKGGRPRHHLSCTKSRKIGSAWSRPMSRQAVDTEDCQSQTRAAVPTSLEASELSPVAGWSQQDMVHVPSVSWPGRTAETPCKCVLPDVGGVHNDNAVCNAIWL